MSPLPHNRPVGNPSGINRVTSICAADVHVLLVLTVLQHMNTCGWFRRQAAALQGIE